MADPDRQRPDGPKRPYSSPRLVRYGHVTHVTHGIDGSRDDFLFGRYYQSDRAVKRDIQPVVW